MKKTNYIRDLLASALLLCSASSWAYSFSASYNGKTIYYSIVSTTDLTCAVTYKNTDFGSYSGTVVIPETVTNSNKTYTVVSIGSGAFRECSSSSLNVTIPESVTEISNYAFCGCSGLTGITIPNSVTSIGYEAFRSCTGLTEITIPNSVTSIGDRAFQNCSGMTQATIGEGVTEISNYTFYGCSGLTGITIPENITEIGSYAFAYCTGLAEVTIPESVTTIGKQAFYGCTDLVEITIPKSVTEISSSTFEGCTGLAEVTIPESVTKIGDYAFRDCIGLTEITIPNSVTTIGEYTFRNSGLTEITIPESITEIGELAFWDCTGLTEVNFNATACTSAGSYSSAYSYIWDGAFYKCTNISTINIGDNVTIIPSNLFPNCTGLTEITIPESVTTIGSRAFYNCTGLTEVNFNATACTSAGSSSSPVFRGCTNIATVNFGENVTIIPAYLCYGLTGLTEVTIPNSVTEISGDAFYNCTGITEVNFNATACTTAGSSAYNMAFYGCTNISTVNFGENVTIIPGYLFYGCTGLTQVTIPESVTEIGSYAFYQCTGLTEATIGGGSIGDYAFYGCTGLTELTIGDSVTSIGSDAFYNCTGLTQVTIPESVTEIGSYAFYGCTGLTQVTIGDSVTSIGSDAFYNCSGLTGTLTIPESVTEIGSYAFRGCTGLTSVTIGESVTTIGDYAFSCSGLKSIYSLNPEPPSCSLDWYGGVFHNVDKRACTLYVPEGSKTAYSTAYAWRDFYNIEEIDMSPLTVETYEATEITPTSATLNGRAVASYNEGITEQGFEYWTADAEEADTITAEGEDMSVTIMDLTENTTYSYRAYVITEFDATRYGETLTFTTLYGSLHDTVTGETEEVRDSLGNVWSVVMTDYADVVDGFREEYEALSDELERLVQGLDDAYNDGTLTEEYAEEVRQRLEEISTETGKILDEAKEAESSYLYSTITGRIKEAESTLGEIWNTILTDCPHVAEGYEDTRDAISDKLEELLQDVEETYKAGELTKETTEETESALETIAQETEDMLAAAKRAESDYLYAVVDDIKEVESLLSDTWETIETDYAVVADDLTDTRDALASELDKLMQSVDEDYKNGGLTIEKVKAIESSLEAIRQEIEALPAYAETAREGYLQALLDEIREEAESALDNAWSELTTECADVASDFWGDYEALATEIGELLQGAEDAYKNKTFGDEMIEEVRQSLAAIEQKIDEMLTSAKQAESEYLYSIVDDIKEVEVLLSDIWETMEEECADVMYNYKDDYDAIASELAELTQSVEDAHSQGGLTRTVATGITSSLEAIRQEIDDMLANAKAAENEYIYAMMDGIGEVEDMLDSAWETIETECADVMYNYKDNYDAIANELEELRQIVEDAYKQGNLVTSMAETITNSLETIKHEIEDMLTAAKAAQEALGIDGIISDYGDDVWIYDLSGRRVLAPERGNVYIFRYMDGTVKKMLVK